MAPNHKPFSSLGDFCDEKLHPSRLLNLSTTDTRGRGARSPAGQDIQQPPLGDDMTFKTAPSVKRPRGRRRGGQTPQLRIRAPARPPPELSPHQVLQALGGRVRPQKRLGQSGPGCLPPWQRRTQALTQAALPLRRQCSKVIFTFVEVGDGGGCVLEGDPERKSWLLTHSV